MGNSPWTRKFILYIQYSSLTVIIHLFWTTHLYSKYNFYTISNQNNVSIVLWGLNIDWDKVRVRRHKINWSFHDMYKQMFRYSLKGGTRSEPELDYTLCPRSCDNLPTAVRSASVLIQYRLKKSVQSNVVWDFLKIWNIILPFKGKLNN